MKVTNTLIIRVIENYREYKEQRHAVKELILRTKQKLWKEFGETQKVFTKS